MKKILYHGSSNIIEHPIYGFGKPYNDYGKAFYCTEDMTLAREWAVDEGRDGYTNCYSILMDHYSVLDLCSGDYTILNWLAILLDNRTFDLQSDIGREAKAYILDNFLPDYNSYDIICGYRADDSYFTFARDFLDNSISVRTLSKAMELGRLGIQYAVKSRDAFDGLVYQGYEQVSSAEWYPSREYRDNKARSDYRRLREAGRVKGDLYMLQILDEEVKSDDVRLRPEPVI